MPEIFQKSRTETLRCSQFNYAENIEILRDDLIHPLISGNKWRKLKYVIQEAINQNKNEIVTFGGAYSNHLLATAAAGEIFGIKTTAFVRGDEERELNKYETLCIENGMKLIHVSRTAYQAKENLFTTYCNGDSNIEFVGEGGEHKMAYKGCSEIIDELNKEYDYIFISVGTGVTMEGLIQGILEKNLRTKVIGISSLKNNFDLNKRFEKYPKSYWQIEHNYHRGKYATKDLELLEFISDFFNETGIKLEFVYTGKMMMALRDFILTNRIQANQNILCIHTGGILNHST
jgi:1-aminocyclopropane-1-carboxylate deaminase